MAFFKKKSADEAVQDLVAGLTQALGAQLKSILIFGSKASGEFRPERSDVNVFVLLDNATTDVLGQMAPAIQKWLTAGHRMPVLVPQHELQAYADHLPIEFMEMQDHHHMVYGPDPLIGLMVSRTHLRAQCAQELATKLLKLRQLVVATGPNEKRLRERLVESVPSILTLFRAAVRLKGEKPEGTKLMAAKALLQRLDIESDGVERLWDLHLRRETDNIPDLARQYLDMVSRVYAHVSTGEKI